MDIDPFLHLQQHKQKHKKLAHEAKSLYPIAEREYRLQAFTIYQPQKQKTCSTLEILRPSITTLVNKFVDFLGNSR